MSDTLNLTGAEYQDDEYQNAYGQLLIALASEDSVAIAKARKALEALQGRCEMKYSAYVVARTSERIVNKCTICSESFVEIKAKAEHTLSSWMNGYDNDVSVSVSISDEDGSWVYNRSTKCQGGAK